MLSRSGTRGRFEREARAISSLNHPNICTLFDIGSQDELDFLVMEYLEGQTLATRLKQSPLPYAAMLRVALEVTGALAYAHGCGVIHRDVKPANIMLTTFGAKLLDFGLARWGQEALGAIFPPADSSVSVSGMILGTPRYMSPEQIERREVDARTDVFILGVVLYEMATGRMPFPGETSAAVMDAILRAAPEPASRVNPEIPPQLEQIVAKALEKEPAARYQTAAELRAALERLERGRDSGGPRRKLRWAYAAGAVAAIAALFVLNVAGLRGRLLNAFGLNNAAAPPGIESIAVLPLENLSRDPADEYFAAGLTDSLIADLGQMITVRVISRTSVMRYQGTRKPLPEIARELNVDAAVEGTVQRSGNRVRITAKLLQARTDRQLWAETYDRDVADVIQLERQMAVAIAHEVTGRLTPAQETRLARGGTANPRAYEAYLRGRYLLNQRIAELFPGAVDYFEQALREDPHFALAYAGLADCYGVGWWAKPNTSVAEKYARKALALEPDLSPALASLGLIDTWRFRFADAAKELTRALDLNPNYAMAHHYRSAGLLMLGHLEEALAENDRARQLDPFSLPVNHLRVDMLIGLHQYDRALEQAETEAAIQPLSHHPHVKMARIYWIEGRVPQALAEDRKVAALAHLPVQPGELGEVAAAFARSGLHAARVKSAEFEEKRYHPGDSTWENAGIKSAQLNEKGYPGAYRALQIAYQYGLAGDRGKALVWLTQAFRDDDGNADFVKTAPELDGLRGAPPFHDLLRRIGLEQ
jgi:TolB-like protein/Tfp pilus assembly protein PilF